MGKPRTRATAPAPTTKRGYLKQTDVPATSLEDALRVPRVIFDHYAGKAATPMQLGKALDVAPKGSQLTVLTGAAIAFGLIDGGVQAASIAVTDLARRIIRPTDEGADLVAKREAVLKPRVFGDFLRQYDGNAFPRADIAVNVLEELGVPRDKAAEVLERIDVSARSVGFLEEIKGKIYVVLQGANAPLPAPDPGELPPELKEPLGRYLRRLVALAGFGIVAEVFFGYSVLVGLAVSYDVSPKDGSFLMVRLPSQTTGSVVVVTNWVRAANERIAAERGRPR